jgi:Cu(I)/Ag(I) efflux system membrane protein CusA/SilA
MGYLIRGRIPRESANPLNRVLIWSYRPLLERVLAAPRFTLLLALLVVLSMAIPLYGAGGLLTPLKWPLQLTDTPAAHQAIDRIETWQASLGNGLGSEFMPELFEGDIMYMPTTLPGLSIGKAQELLQQTDRLIRQVPEVQRVFGKIGRAETATDPAPLTMIETLIKLKPRSEWRPGTTPQTLIAELDATVNFPGLTNAWIMPIKTRIDMQATGIKTPVGVKVAGPDVVEIERIGRQIEKALLAVPGTASAYSERVAAGRYIEIIPRRLEAARLGINVDDINQVVSAAVGGINITETVEGLERYPINVRFPREQRDDVEKLRELPLVTPAGAQVPLSQVAEVRVVDGPPLLKSENARLNGWTFVDIRDVDLGSYVRRAQQQVRDQVDLPPGYSISWSGQYEYMLRAQQKLAQVVPLTLVIIFLLLYLTFKRVGEAALVMLTLPFALVGGFWLLLLLDFNLSVAVAVGFIALAGIAAEFGVVMLIYLNNSVSAWGERGELNTDSDLSAAIIEGAVMRVRPKAMTVAVVVAGLLPIMLSEGTGSEVMQRIAAPVVGGMITAPLLSLFVMPAIYLLWKRRLINRP